MALGGAHTSATVIDNAGTVTITFSSGLRGTISLPGEVPKEISKFSFGYGNGPDGLLGSYLLTYISTLSNVTFSRFVTLNTNTGVSTTYGNGLVTDSTITVGCENQISGTLAGDIVCVESPETSYSDQYVFKISGDRGTGIGKYTVSSNFYPLHVIRTATRSGIQTGLNEGTVETLSNQLIPFQPNVMRSAESIKADMIDGELTLSPDKAAAFNEWANNVKKIMSTQRRIQKDH